jgi:hypothetical protein
LKEKHSRKVCIIVNKNYKNVEEIMKNDSRIQTLMKKYSFIKEDRKQDKPSFLLDNLANNNNEDFYEKCSNIIEIIKAFLDLLSSM